MGQGRSKVPSSNIQAPEKHQVTKQHAYNLLLSFGRLQTWGKIINAFWGEMLFDSGVNRIARHLNRVPACNGGGFGVLIVLQSQHGADL